VVRRDQCFVACAGRERLANEGTCQFTRPTTGREQLVTEAGEEGSSSLPATSSLGRKSLISCDQFWRGKRLILGLVSASSLPRGGRL
jgi:hypothetical protein